MIVGVLLTLFVAAAALVQEELHAHAHADAVRTRRSIPTITNNCSSAAFSVQAFRLPGSDIRSITAAPNTNVTGLVSQAGTAIPPVGICNITLIYGHESWNDTIAVTIWLPLQNWTSRLVGAGGGGLAVRSGDDTLAVEVAAGRAAFASDGGHDPNLLSADSWALNSTGKVNYFLLEDYASVALNDAVILAKQVILAYYGAGTKFYTYWNGCSGGGRQGYMLAQRYPTAVDGVLAGAPAINWVQLLPEFSWPSLVMTQIVKTIPPPCVFDYFTNNTIAACDGLDGVIDGIISAWDKCSFDPSSLVGQSVDCGALGHTQITQGQADVVKKMWQGPHAEDGSFIWYGLTPGTPLQLGFNLGGFGLDQATVVCSGSVSNCTIQEFEVAGDWIRLFIYENPKLNSVNITYAQWEFALNQTALNYGDLLATANPDLSGFKTAGGKLLSWQGTADQLIPPQGTHNYFDRVERLDPEVREYYRHFDAPGINHCLIGKSIGFAPTSLMERLIDWVEGGEAPEELLGETEDGAKTRPLCVYPLVAGYIGGNTSLAGSFECRKTF